MEFYTENKKIIQFFQENQMISIESFLVHSIEIHQYISTQFNTNDTQFIVKQLMDEQKVLKEDLKTLLLDQSTRIASNNVLLLDSTKKDLIASLQNNTDREIILRELENVKQNSPLQLQHLLDKIIMEFKQTHSELKRDLIEQKKLNIKSLDSIKDSINTSIDSITELSNNLLNSSKKGNISENILEIALSKHFPMYDITRTSKTANAGDFIMQLGNQNPVLIENKEYSRNCPKDEVLKFHRDLVSNKMSGVFISQQSGIANKSNFSFDVLENQFIAFYITNCHYDITVIESALSILESLNKLISVPETKNQITLTREIFSTLQNEYNNIILTRNNVVENLQNSIKELNKLNIKTLQTFIEKYKTHISTLFSCQHCETDFDTKRGLNLHIRKTHKL